MYLHLYLYIYIYYVESVLIAVTVKKNDFFIFTSLRDGNRPHRIVGQPLVTANDVGHWDQKHPKVLIVGKKQREEFDSHV